MSGQRKYFNLQFGVIPLYPGSASHAPSDVIIIWWPFQWLIDQFSIMRKISLDRITASPGNSKILKWFWVRSARILSDFSVAIISLGEEWQICQSNYAWFSFSCRHCSRDGGDTLGSRHRGGRNNSTPTNWMLTANFSLC